LGLLSATPPVVDYWTIAIITIFTSFFAGIGKEIAEEVIKYIRKRELINRAKKKVKYLKTLDKY
jgi:hypothetical protein